MTAFYDLNEGVAEMLIESNAIAEWIQIARSTHVRWNGEEISKTLDAPLDYPSWTQSILEGDVVAIAFGLHIPSLGELVPILVQYLLSKGVGAEQIRLVLATDSKRAREEVERVVFPLGLRSDQVSLHDGANEKELEILAGDENGDPVYASRALMEADVILPVVAIRPPDRCGYFGSQGIAPWFLDTATQNRIRSLFVDETEAGIESRRELGDWVGRLAGVALILGLQVDSVTHQALAIAGTPSRVERYLLHELPTHRESGDVQPAKEDLDWIVADMGGSRAEQSWDEIADTVADLATRLKDNGHLVICCTLAKRPTAAFRLLAGLEDDEYTEAKLLKSELPHANAALQLLRSMRRIHLYVLSGLAPDEIESLGIGSVEGPEAIHRLIRHSSHGAFVTLAQYCAHDCSNAKGLESAPCDSISSLQTDIST